MDDPFPPSLPGYESPRIFGLDSQDRMEDIGPEFYDETVDFANDLFPNHHLNDFPCSPAPLKGTDNGPSGSSQPAEPKWSTSPESSSGSDQSSRHGRKNSDEMSGIEDPSVADRAAANGILIGADCNQDTPMGEEEFMESAFDFMGASSNRTSSKTADLEMPVQCVPMVDDPATSTRSGSNCSRNSSDASLARTRNRNSQRKTLPKSIRNPGPSQASCSPSDLVKQGPIPERPHVFDSSSRTDPGPIATFLPPDLQQAPPVAAPVPPPESPQLYISNFTAKSRVEAQHLLRYTIDPLPSGIRRLHLQRYTMSKAKAMSKPSPERSPDMLEMFVTVVCSSAMADADKRENAFLRAKGPLSAQEEHCPSPSSDTDKENGKPKATSEKPSDSAVAGCPVKVCSGCRDREKRRSERRKVVDPKEQAEWLRFDVQRTVVFNASEVLEWKPLSDEKFPGEKEKLQPCYEVPTNFSLDAMHVDIPTRISCYCRHHDEKVGFRLLVTIRDFEDNVIVSTMSNSIMITDDHKTNPALNASQPIPLSHQPQMHGFPVGNFAPGYNKYPQPALISRNARSATDLNSFNHRSFSGVPHQMRQYAISPESSLSTSTMVPTRDLSRPASPTLHSSQQKKRRRGSGSGRMPDALTMTSLSGSPVTPPGVRTYAPSDSLSSGMHFPGHALNGEFSPSYIEAPGLPFPPAPYQFMHTNPPTPGTSNSAYSSQHAGNQRSHSMENLTQTQMSASTSTLPSRDPSPPMTNRFPQSHHGAVPYANGPAHPTMVPHHAQMLANSLSSINPMATLPQGPVINRIIPTEGTVAGGTEISCIGGGFTPGMEVMFGDARATSTTFCGANILVCTTPPAMQAGPVTVTFKHEYEQDIMPPVDRQKIYRYINSENLELFQLMLKVMPPAFLEQMNASSPPGEMTLNGMESLRQQTSGGSSLPSPHAHLIQGEDDQRRFESFAASMPKPEAEAFLMNCLDQMDLDESLGQADLNLRGTSGQTMLHLSACLGYYRVTAGLLARGANPLIPDFNGMSPLHMASLHSNIRIVRKLRSAGGDPTQRSLNGFTPSDMTARQEVKDAINALDHRIRSRSAGVASIKGVSRASSVLSRASSIGEYDLMERNYGTTTHAEDFEIYGSHPVTPAQMRARSRRNSMKAEDHDPNNTPPAGLESDASHLAAHSALAAWRDQLSAQIQQFQQTVHRALLPLPNLPDYQDYPVVRRISSLVPQRNPSPMSSAESRNHGKDRWWDLFTGITPSPPSYEDIYPDKERGNSDHKVVSAVRAAKDAFMDNKCRALFDRGESSSVMETINIGEKSLTQEQQDRLRSAHAQKMKKIRSDRNLFFIWIPLLILVVLAMLKDRAPELIYAARQTYSYLRDRIQDRVVEAVM